jgi:nucleotide-binding universal stress UspA family protein
MPSAIRTVVVGVDFTEPSLDALSWTARNFAPEARLLAVHIVAVPEPPGFLRGRFPAGEELVASAVAGAEVRLKAILSERGIDRAEPIVREGAPAEQLEQAAAEQGGELLVVGPHGERPGVWRLIGGTAQRIARRSKIPVVVARGLPPHAPRHVLVPLDDSALTRPVLNWGARLAREHGARLTAVHVISDSLRGAIRIGASPREVQEAQDNLVKWADTWLREQVEDAGITDLRVACEVRLGDAAHEILTLAEMVEAELIVMGRSGSGRVGEMILGSVANSVLRNGSGPIVLVGNEVP